MASGGFQSSLAIWLKVSVPTARRSGIWFRYLRGVLSEIPANIPPWLRSLYEAEQLMQLSGEADAATATEAEQFIDDPRDVVWVWKDWNRADLESTLNEAGEQVDAAFALLDEGNH